MVVRTASSEIGEQRIPIFGQVLYARCDPPDRHVCLAPEHVEVLLAAAGSDRHGRRNRALLLTLYLHGLLVSEVCALRVKDLDRERGELVVCRQKRGRSGIHPVAPPEMAVLDAYLSARRQAGPWLFLSERGGRLTRQAAHYLIRSAGRKAGFPFEVTAQHLRRARGCHLVGEGWDEARIQIHMGHRTVSPTMCYLSAAAEAERVDPFGGRRLLR